MAFLEKMVHPVRSPHAGGLFHPKIWLLEFSAGAETSFRFLCTSRNLTSDRSWDVVVRLDGACGSRSMAANKPLRDLALGLPTWAVPPMPAERLDRIRGLADSDRYAVWERPDDVGEIIFHALGVTRRRSSLDFTGTRHLVISPFATDDGLRHVAPSGSKSVQVVSRAEDLDRLDPQALSRLTATYVIDDAAALERADDTATTGKDLLAGLHAKTYVIERGYAAHLVLGSANATRAAFVCMGLADRSATPSRVARIRDDGPAPPVRDIRWAAERASARRGQHAGVRCWPRTARRVQRSR
jgi:hypothetical protein